MAVNAQVGGFHGGVFSTMKFPKYQFREYPKRITLPTGERVRVMDQADELRVKSQIPLARPQTEVERERDAIVVERDDLAIQLDAKQSEAAKLREELAEMKAKLAEKLRATDEPVKPTAIVASAAGPTKK